MGDISDAMLDGTLCEGCGTYLGDTNGFPNRCMSCRKNGPDWSKKVTCPMCLKKVKNSGLADHQRDKHGSNG